MYCRVFKILQENNLKMINFLLKCFSFVIGMVMMKLFAIVEKVMTKRVLSIMMKSGAAQTPHVTLAKEILGVILKKFRAMEEH